MIRFGNTGTCPGAILTMVARLRQGAGHSLPRGRLARDSLPVEVPWFGEASTRAGSPPDLAVQVVHLLNRLAHAKQGSEYGET